MSDDEREPDTTDDPRQQGTGTGGYPESNPADQSPGDGTESGKGEAEEKSPDTHSGQDDSPSGATGNPGAAGG